MVITTLRVFDHGLTWKTLQVPLYRCVPIGPYYNIIIP